MARSAACSGRSARSGRCIVGVVLLAFVSVLFTVIGPKILGNAVNTIFEGALGKQLSDQGDHPAAGDRRGAGAAATTSWPTS